MVPPVTPAIKPANDSTDVKTMVIVVLTFIFVALYAAALFGLIKLPADDKLLGRIEPIVAVIIGYYFGRAPSEKIEKSLKQQVDQKTQEAGAAKDAEMQAEKRTSELETKVSSARAALGAAAPTAEPTELATTLSGGSGPATPDLSVRSAAIAALKVLEA